MALAPSGLLLPRAIRPEAPLHRPPPLRCCRRRTWPPHTPAPMAICAIATTALRWLTGNMSPSRLNAMGMTPPTATPVSIRSRKNCQKVVTWRARGEECAARQERRCSRQLLMALWIRRAAVHEGARCTQRCTHKVCAQAGPVAHDHDSRQQVDPVDLVTQPATLQGGAGGMAQGRVASLLDACWARSCGAPGQLSHAATYHLAPAPGRTTPGEGRAGGVAGAGECARPQPGAAPAQPRARQRQRTPP